MPDPVQCLWCIRVIGVAIRFLVRFVRLITTVTGTLNVALRVCTSFGFGPTDSEELLVEDLVLASSEEADGFSATDSGGLARPTIASLQFAGSKLLVQTVAAINARFTAMSPERSVPGDYAKIITRELFIELVDSRKGRRDRQLSGDAKPAPSTAAAKAQRRNDEAPSGFAASQRRLPCHHRSRRWLGPPKSDGSTSSSAMASSGTPDSVGCASERFSAS